MQSIALALQVLEQACAGHLCGNTRAGPVAPGEAENVSHPRATMNDMTNGIEVSWEGDEVTFAREGRALDPAEGMAALFGRFELLAKLQAVRSPGPEVLVYRPPTPRARRRLDLFPAHTWLHAERGLWLTHDGEHLLLAPTDPVMAGNMGA